MSDHRTPAETRDLVAEHWREQIAKAPEFESLPFDDQVFIEEARARGAGPFDEGPLPHRERAARFVFAATGKRIRISDCGSSPRCRVLARPRGAGRPRGRRTRTPSAS